MEQQVRDQQREIEQQAREAARQGQDFNFNFNMDQARGPVTLFQGKGLTLRGPDSMLYSNGQNAIDNHRYDQALENFNEVVTRGGPRAEGALYWKAYTLNKLGKRDEALAAIAQLRKSYPSSKWLEEAKALEFDVQQASGKPPSPEAQADDDLKLLALNALAQSDPDRALPLLDKLLQGPQPPSLKKRAVFVLASSSAPKAQQSLEQIARGSLGNPDLQLVAISYMLSNKGQPNRNQVLSEIYASTNDTQVKRAILQAYGNSHDYDRLLQAAKMEKDKDLKKTAINGLGDKTGQPELWQLYTSETTPEGKIMVIDYMHRNGNTEKLAEIARTDKDAGVRTAAIRALNDQQDSGPNTITLLVNLYGTEQDAQVKRTIINSLVEKRNAKALVDIYHKEQSIEMKKTIVARLGGMHSPEANELYLEILKP
jgi:tetratricopeptide (TPR) repeat protein